MIEYKTGNILAEDAEALVNTVNCVGVMGRGIALQFKRAYPGTSKSTRLDASATRYNQGECLFMRRASLPALAT